MNCLTNQILSAIVVALTTTISLAQPIHPFEPDRNTLALYHFDGFQADSLNSFTNDTNYRYTFEKVIAARNGGFLITGQSWNLEGDHSSGFLIKTDENLRQEWVRRYGFEYSISFNDLIESENGEILLFGYNSRMGEDNRLRSQFLLMRVNEAGDSLSSRGFLAANVRSYGSKMIQVDDGLLLVGTVNPVGENKQLRLIRLDSRNEIVWERIIENEWDVNVLSVIHSNDNGFLITEGRDGHGALVTKVNSEGEVVWSRGYLEQAGISYGTCESALTYNDGYLLIGRGGIFFAREDDGIVYATIRLIHIDENGDERWRRNYGDVEHPRYGNGMIRTDDGGYLITGSGTRPLPPTGRDNRGIGIFRLDSDFNFLWDHFYGTVNSGAGHQVFQNANGGYAIFGEFQQNIAERNGPGILAILTDNEACPAKDFSGNNRNGVISARKKIVEGKFSNALGYEFDQYDPASVPEVDWLNIPVFTIECWFKMSDAASKTGLLIGKQYDDNDLSFELSANNEDDIISWKIKTDVGDFEVTCSAVPDAGWWNHVAASYDGEYIWLTYNTRDYVAEANGNLWLSDRPLLIGSCFLDGTGDLLFGGTIDEVRISDCARYLFEDGISERLNPLPTTPLLLDAYPNPFNSRLNITFRSSPLDRVKVELISPLGSIIPVNFSGTQRPGTNHLFWDATGFPAGSYILHVNNDKGEFLTKRITLLK